MQLAYEQGSSNSIYAGYLIKALNSLIVSSKGDGKRQPVQNMLSKLNKGEFMLLCFVKWNHAHRYMYSIEVSDGRKGERRLVWQVPQRRDYLTEDLSLADEISQHSKAATENDKIYHNLFYSCMHVCTSAVHNVLN